MRRPAQKWLMLTRLGMEPCRGLPPTRFPVRPTNAQNARFFGVHITATQLCPAKYPEEGGYAPFCGHTNLVTLKRNSVVTTFKACQGSKTPSVTRLRSGVTESYPPRNQLDLVQPSLIGASIRTSLIASLAAGWSGHNPLLIGASIRTTSPASGLSWVICHNPLLIGASIRTMS
jgi:hypothetical protein